MMHIKKFIFNPFQENTYLLYDDTRQCLIIDPGCYEDHEKEALVQYIEKEKLKPVYLLNTHTHIDHIVGNTFVREKYNIPYLIHKAALPFLSNISTQAKAFGFEIEAVATPDAYLEEGRELEFGQSRLQVFYTPGHADGSICLYAADESFVIVGDVLFKGSIGRTDLPSGNYDLLQQSIWEKLFTLPDGTIVHPGHGPETNIGTEKVSNPFVAIGRG